MNCRQACAACCIIPSISSKIPGLPEGKPAFVPCVQLDEALRCRLFNQLDRPRVCRDLKPSREMCGQSRQDAMDYLTHLEDMTKPDR